MRDNIVEELHYQLILDYMIANIATTSTVVLNRRHTGLQARREALNIRMIIQN
jgi:hypothetical protein